MEYGLNILHTSASAYTFQNASISNGRLQIGADGYARTYVTLQDLAKLPSHLRLNLIPDAFTDSYSPKACVRLRIGAEQTFYEYVAFPVYGSTGIYSVDFELDAGLYDSFEVTFEAAEAISFSLWELCPEVTSDIETIIEGVEQSLPRLLYDYNTLPLVIDQEEKSIALITCVLLDATDLQGHFLITYDASQACTLTLRFMDTEATELFAPVLYDINAGRGTIGVPHAYLARLVGYHNFVVTAQVSAGQLQVNTRAILFTIDGGYLAARTIDIGMDTCDITIERKSTDASPSFFWAIGLDAGELLVRRREANALKTGVPFEPVYSLGQALDGAIEFDGTWRLLSSDTSALYRFDTDDTPYCFIITLDHDLYVQLGNDETTRQLLDTSVDKVQVCRGFKSLYYPEQDQGLIALYIKGGVAWYRQYAYSITTGTYLWQPAIRVDQVQGTVLDVHVHRLNDYRVGFNITTEDHNYWLISSRTYVGQAYKPEVVDMRAVVKLKARQLMWPIEDLALVSVELAQDKLSLTATFSHPIRCTEEPIAQYITMPDAFRTMVSNITIQDNVLCITTNAAIRALYTITIPSGDIWNYETQEQWLELTQSYTLDYDPYAPIYNTVEEALTFYAHPTLVASERGIETIPYEYEEEADFTAIVQLVGTPRAITDIDNSHNSGVANFTATATLVAVLTQVGDTPI